MDLSKIIDIAAAIITDQDGQVLLVRKQNSIYFMQAGGKIEREEKPIQALIRELHEELGLVTKPNELTYIGEYLMPAANEANYHIRAHLFSIVIKNTIFTAQAELAEVGWYSIEQTRALILAPLTKEVILPFIEKNKPA